MACRTLRGERARCRPVAAGPPAVDAGLARDPRTPRSSKDALGGLAVWLASPIDLIPEFLPVIGPLDDIVLTAIVLRWVGRRVGVDALRALAGV